MSDYMAEIVDRSAPRWAWAIIDETLDLDSRATNFDAPLRKEIKDALAAMIQACEASDDSPIPQP